MPILNMIVIYIPNVITNMTGMLLKSRGLQQLVAL